MSSRQRHKPNLWGESSGKLQLGLTSRTDQLWVMLSEARTKGEADNLAPGEFEAGQHRVDRLELFARLAAGWDHDGWERQRAAEKKPAAWRRNDAPRSRRWPGYR